MRKKKVIKGIHNYCDRWCEKCQFRAQCSVFREESKLTDNQKDINSEEFWNNIEKNFQNTIELLQEMAFEQGIDLDALPQQHQKTIVIDYEVENRKKKLEEYTREYIKIVDNWFLNHQNIFRRHEDEINQQLQLNIVIDKEALEALSNSIETIRWYQMFISAKVHRSLSGLVWVTDWSEIDPIQNDANGSAKITLIGIERSLVSWEIIRNNFPEATDSMIDIFLILGKIQKEMKSFFPHAMKFVRPGFDSNLNPENH